MPLCRCQQGCVFDVQVVSLGGSRDSGVVVDKKSWESGEGGGGGGGVVCRM